MARTINKVELLGRVGYRAGDEAHVAALPSPSCGWRPTAAARTGRSRPTGTTWSSGDKTAEAVNAGRATASTAGRLVQNTWEGDDGQRRYRTEIHASEVVFLDSRNGGRDNGDAADVEEPVAASPF